jgi:hypothetical protein
MNKSAKAERIQERISEGSLRIIPVSDDSRLDSI